MKKNETNENGCNGRETAKSIHSAKTHKYIRLLSYENACKVIDFVNSNDKYDYANIVTGGISIQASKKNWKKIEDFIQSLRVRYSIGTLSPHEVKEAIVNNLKSNGFIKSESDPELEKFNSGKDKIELLLEDYERKLTTITCMINDFKSNGSILHIQKKERLVTKQNEYRTFISELKRITQN